MDSNLMSPSATRRDCLRLLGGAGALSLGFSAGAQTYPAKTITLIVPYPAGGAVDSLARLMAEKMAKRLGQSIVVDNRSGASGVIGTDAVAKAAPDGHTLLLALSSALMFNRFLIKKLPYDPDKDIVLVSQVATGTVVVAVNAGVPVNNLSEFLKYLAANKGKVAYGSPGIGTAHHLYGSHLSQLQSADVSHVPYRGETPLVQDLVSGQIQMGFLSGLAAKTWSEQGKVKLIAVTGEKRMSVLPNVPTFAEQGVSDPVFRTVGWLGMAAPGATPKAVLQRLADEVKAVCALPEVQQRILSFGFEPSFRGPEEFNAVYKSELPIWQRVVKVSGATLD
jgi:tripartite-type tricarboxylate transporter receptor subunit TctC